MEGGRAEIEARWVLLLLLLLRFVNTFDLCPTCLHACGAVDLIHNIDGIDIKF